MKISSTKAAILVEQKKPLVIDTVELPEYLKVGQILVKVETSGICGSQIGEIEELKEKIDLPHLMGHEASAIVIEIGEGVNKYPQVTSYSALEKKQREFNLSHQFTNGMEKNLNAGWVTTFNEYAIISEK